MDNFEVLHFICVKSVRKHTFTCYISISIVIITSFFKIIVTIIFSGSDNCITNNEDFATVCLHPAVLRNVLVCLNNVRGDDWNLAENR